MIECDLRENTCNHLQAQKIIPINHQPMKQYNAKAHLLEEMQRPNPPKVYKQYNHQSNGVTNLKSEQGLRDFL